VEPGARWLVLNETPAPGNNDNDKFGKREGPPAEKDSNNPPKKGRGTSKGTGTD
jgi:hypothetical protein